MKRRNFLKSITAAVVGIAALPAALKASAYSHDGDKLLAGINGDLHTAISPQLTFMGVGGSHYGYTGEVDGNMYYNPINNQLQIYHQGKWTDVGKLL